MTEYRHLARINKATLGWEDHGIFQMVIDVTYEGGGLSQGIGMHSLGSERWGYDLAGSYITGMMRAIGVDEWADIQGRLIYVLSDSDVVLGMKPLGIQGLDFGKETGRRFVFRDWQEMVRTRFWNL